MGKFLRSEDMTKLRLVFNDIAAHDTMDELGGVGMFELEDSNAELSDFQRHFASNVRRCEEAQRRLRFLEAELQMIGLKPSENYQQMPGDGLKFDVLDSHLEALEKNVQSINTNWKLLNSKYNTLVEQKCVLEKGAEFFKNAPMVQKASSYGATEPMANVADSFVSMASAMASRSSGMTGEQILLKRQSVNVSAATPDMLTHTMGVLVEERAVSFDRVLFRASRGNAFSRFMPVEDKIVDPETNEPTKMVVFIIFHFGSEMASKVEKICKAFQARVYPYPERSDEQMKAYESALSQLNDLETTIDTTKMHHMQLLAELVPKLAVWKDFVMREKAIYHALNMVKTDKKMYVATGWAPTQQIDEVRAAVERGRSRSNSQVQTMIETQDVPKGVEPPTYFELNRFTAVFHGIVESYAVARYKEVNPAPFAVVTFPFLFAVMFGDIGHGIIMAFVAFMIIYFEKQLAASKLDEMTLTVFDGRYIIFLMGCFSIYTGFLYNEFFAVPLNIFGSRWKYTDASEMACGIDNCDDPAAVKAPLSPYPFGFDPVWKPAETGLLFFNSYKMKLSILLGVSQMCMGLVLSYKNARFFKEPIDVWWVFVPQMIFINSIFGYLCFLIVLKWCIDWDSPACNADPDCVPPDLKAILIGMIMAPGSLDPKLQMYPGQMQVQTVLLVAAMLSVPVMFLAKPFLLKARHDQETKAEMRPLLGDEESSRPAAKVAAEVDDEANHGHGEVFDFANTMVENMIHSIEFVLGCVSNTASYLRLWALSLAHSELSDVFLEKLVFMGAASGSSVIMVICYFMWVGATIGVLMLMESLSAFLHVLRLHWVEFQNKFYSLHGPGQKFAPFSYEDMRKEAAAA